MATRKLQVEIVGDSSSLQRAFGKAADSGDKLGGTFKSIAKVGALAGVALGGALAIGAKKSIDAASNLNESMNAVNVTFGKSAKIVTDFSKNAAQRTGLSMRELNESVVPIGASLQNMGLSSKTAADASISLAKRAADMASVFNTDVGDALGAIQAGLRGEADPLERFGVGLSAAAVDSFALTSGLAKTKDEITDQVKVQARLGLLMKQSGKFAGDFANTSDGLANSQRILKAEIENAGASIGTALLPVAGKVVGIFADLVPKAVEVGSAITEKVGPALTTFAGKIQEAIPVVIGVIKPLAEEIGSRLIPIFLALRDIGAEAISRIGEIVQENGPQLQQIFRNLGTVISNLAKIVLPILEIAFTKVLPAAIRILIPVLVVLTTALAKISQIAVPVARVITEVLAKAISSLMPVINALVSAFNAAWPRVSSAVRAAANIIGPIIKGIVTVVRGMVDLVVGILTGDWARAWSGIKQIVRGAIDAVKGYLLGVPAAMLKLGAAIGEAIIQGIGNGLDALLDWLLGKAEGLVSSVKDKLTFWSSGPDEFGEKVGTAVGKGMGDGLDKSAKEVAQKAADLVKAAKDAVTAARQDFASAFESLASEALSAFDAVVSAWQPKAQIRLDQLHAKEQLAQLKKDISQAATDVATAQAELQKALAGGDPEEIKSAQDAVTSALAQQLTARRALRDYNLEQEAAAQQAAHDKQAARERIQFENQLSRLQAAYANQEITTKEFHKRLNKLLAKHGVDQEFYGTAVGIQFANGIQKSTAAVVNAITKLLKRIERLMKLRSPAEEGPLSDLDKWWTPLFDTLLSGVDLNEIKRFGVAVGDTLAGELRGGPTTADFGSSLIDWMIGVKNAAPDTVGAFEQVGEAKDALGENVKTFSTEASAGMDTVTDSVAKLGERSETVLPQIGIILGKTLKDANAPLTAMAGLFDLVTEAVRGLRFRLYELRDGARDTIPEIVSLLGGGSIAAAVNTLKGRAGGGPVTGGQPYIVGENGPELFIPSSSGYVSPSTTTGGGAIIELNFYGPTVGTSREFEDTVRRALYDVQRRNPGTGLATA